MFDRSPRVSLLVLAAVSGFLLFLSDFPVHAWPLQLIALIPWLYGLRRFTPGVLASLGAGSVLGLCYTLPLLIVLQFPILLGVSLAVYLTILWMALSAGAARLFRGAPLLSALAVGSLAVVVEWINISVIPVWGTAQTFTRVWSASPWSIQLVALTGVTGLVFVLVAAQALVAVLLTGPGRRATAIALAICLVAPLVTNQILWSRDPKGRIRVAAMGWNFEHLPDGRRTSHRRLFAELYLPLLRRAVDRGARLVVSPETGFRIPRGEVAEFKKKMQRVALVNGVALAVGYFNHELNQNRVLLIDRSGRSYGEYVKTHLIMTLERYKPGDGTPQRMRIGKHVLGTLICQDDNFTDLTRHYGRLGISLMAVPTNDWKQVKDYHFENSLFRAVENRYGVVRAATNGISAIFTARGEVLARRDHFQSGPGVVVADLPLYGPAGTLYSRGGDWLVVVCLLLLGFALGLRWRRRREPAPP